MTKLDRAPPWPRAIEGANFFFSEAKFASSPFLHNNISKQRCVRARESHLTSFENGGKKQRKKQERRQHFHCPNLIQISKKTNIDYYILNTRPMSSWVIKKNKKKKKTFKGGGGEPWGKKSGRNFDAVFSHIDEFGCIRLLITITGWFSAWLHFLR